MAARVIRRLQSTSASTGNPFIDARRNLEHHAVGATKTWFYATCLTIPLCGSIGVYIMNNVEHAHPDHKAWPHLHKMEKEYFWGSKNSLFHNPEINYNHYGDAEESSNKAIDVFEGRNTGPQFFRTLYYKLQEWGGPTLGGAMEKEAYDKMVDDEDAKVFRDLKWSETLKSVETRHDSLRAAPIGFSARKVSQNKVSSFQHVKEGDKMELGSQKIYKSYHYN